MERVYENPGFAKRMNASCVVIVVAVLFGLFELWSAWQRPEGAQTNYIFALFFIGGAIYASKHIREAGAHTVTSLDLDAAAGRAVVNLWKPFGRKRLEGPSADLRDWQFQVRSGKVRAPILTVHHPAHSRPLEFELGPGMKVSDTMRGLAPEAFEAYERRAA